MNEEKILILNIQFNHYHNYYYYTRIKIQKELLKRFLH